ncbi:hypothetical protein [Endozoicomonas sp. 8E]|uniref:hypothetical protein n=1 Tax=Endozoicomonas sp. 8E TaxID=3035692 RepID=UPI002938F410|nr:hypothetical protein [Endozoicomonas sp. 8E]WOG28162.1 hypothetical protein P6910_00480 [Endozoicomonas sp. 8E]
MLEVLISATNAFCKYMKADLDRLPSPDGKRIGTQPIASGDNVIAWQVHAVKGYRNRKEYTDVIAVEARSRYAILFSNPMFSDLNEFAERFTKRWARECIHMAIESGATTEDQAQTMYDQFLDREKVIRFVRNTDLSVNGHVTDAEQWLSQSYELYGLEQLKESEEIGLGMQRINCVRKKARAFPGAKHMESFIPMSRMVDDWLFRFARGLSEWIYPETSAGDFPNPFLFGAATLIGQEASLALPDNVVSLDEVRKRKKA